MHKPIKPKAPRKPSPPIKPLKELEIVKNIPIDFDKTFQLNKLINMIPKEIDIDNVYIKCEEDYTDCCCCYENVNKYITAYYIKKVTNKNYEKQLKAYNKKLATYNKKLEEYNEKWSEYLQKLDEYNEYKNQIEINRLEKKLKKLKAS